jgi:hypothetical protein
MLTLLSEARIAIWHAGQVFFAAKILMPARNRGFNAIAVYFAALTLWVYGLMNSSSAQTRPSTDNDSSGTSSYQEHVSLNGIEEHKTRAFRTFGQGIPGITFMMDGKEEFMDVRNADKVLAFARRIYKENYPLSNEPLPPLVENLGTLLRDLGSLPSSYASRVPSESPE